MYKPKDQKERILHRLKISAGQLNKVIKMVESDRYCIDVLLQSQAVQKALKGTDSVILENHLNTCVVDAIKEGKSEEVISEIMAVLKKTE